jgi:hypothetical protein
MGDVIKAEGLVLAINDGTNIYPIGCAKNTTIAVNTEYHELAPKTNNLFREYLPNRRSFTLSGSGLNKIYESYKHTMLFFLDFATGTDTIYTGYLDMIDSSNVYAVFEFKCYISSLTLDSTYGANTTYSYTLQGTGPFVRITDNDTNVVSGGTIPGRNPLLYKLLAVGYKGQWYYNYTGGTTITMGSALNGTTVITVYKAI